MNNKKGEKWPEEDKEEDEDLSAASDMIVIKTGSITPSSSELNIEWRINHTIHTHASRIQPNINLKFMTRRSIRLLRYTSRLIETSIKQEEAKHLVGNIQ